MENDNVGFQNKYLKYLWEHKKEVFKYVAYGIVAYVVINILLMWPDIVEAFERGWNSAQ